MRVRSSLMLPICGFLVLVSGLFWPAALEAQERLDLSRGWRFMVGDNPVYARPEWDDAAWKAIGVDRVWEEQGYEKLDGWAWYRLRVKIPARLRDTARLRDAHLKLVVKKVEGFC